MTQSHETSQARRPNAAIDIIKGLAILAVLWQHAVPASITDGLLGNLWIRPAVPIFFVLLALNLAGSLARSRTAPWARGTWTAYLARRADRIAVPFLIVLALAYLVAIAQGGVSVSPSLLIGGFPTKAPGSYFFTALIPIVAVFPAVFWTYRRSPRWTVVGLVAANVAFEAVALALQERGSGFVASDSLLYQGNPLRYAALVAFGLLLFSDSRPTVRRQPFMALLAVGSAVYLVVEAVAPAAVDIFTGGFIRKTNLLAAPWAWALTALGLRYLPDLVAAGQSVAAALARLGQASYHIYLVQMLWLGIAVERLWGDALADRWSAVAIAPTSFAVCIALGFAYFRLVPSGSLAVRRLTGTRRAPAEPNPPPRSSG